MRKKILSDVVTLVSESFPLPNFADEAATGAYFGKIAPGLVTIAYDVIKSDPAKVLECSNCAPTEAEWKEAIGLSAAPEKIGDGTIMAWLVKNGPALIQFIMTVIAVIPKATT